MYELRIKIRYLNTPAQLEATGHYPDPKAKWTENAMDILRHVADQNYLISWAFSPGDLQNAKIVEVDE